MDKDGPTIVDTFYGELFSGGPDGGPALKPDMTKSTLALILQSRNSVRRAFHSVVGFPLSIWAKFNMGTIFCTVCFNFVWDIFRFLKATLVCQKQCL